MAVLHWPFVATVLLFLLPHGLWCSPAHPTACLGHRGPVLNCSSSGLSLAPQHIQATVSELDLSHNNLLNLFSLHQPHPNLKSIWLGNNSITHLSLCVEGTIRGRRGRAAVHPRQSRSQRRQGCVSWAPSLQLLSVERNQLVQFPEGLGGSESLQVLQLSYNRISTLQPGDLNVLRQLRELYLQHNYITSLQPRALSHLSHLRVLDLSFNLLSTIAPLTYLSLRTIRVGVELRGNRWRCDCSMQSVRRWMAYDMAQGRHAWRMVCASPSALSGRDLLQLDEDHLTCSTADSWTGQHQHHQDITVDEGSEILLPCGTTHQVSTWWTPKGEASLNQSQPGLLIRNIKETDTGLYVCVTESQHGLLAVYNLQIRKTESKTRNHRSVPRGLISQDIIHRVANETKYPTQSDLALAVSLSVIITFLVAFVIGVLVRPCIDILWRRMCTKKETSATYDISAAEQRPYDNEAYSDGEESVQNEGHRERRVTFSTVDNREQSTVPYYDTVANMENTRNGAVIGGGIAMTKEAGSDSSSQQGSPEIKGRGDRNLQNDPHLGPTHRMEFEHIPDPSDLGERGSLSSHSDSSHSDKEQKDKLLMQKDPHTPQFPQLTEDPFQQRSESPTTRPVEVAQTSIEGTGFTSEPFAEWPPKINDQNLRDPDLWNDSGEKFDFSDSIRSGSARSSSLFGSFNRSNQNVLSSSDKWKHSDNSSSSMSEDETTQYTVNSEGEEEGHVEAIQLTHDTKVEIVNPCLKQDASLKQQGHGEDPFRPSLRDEEFNQAERRHDTQSPSVGPERSDSSHSSDSDGEHTQYTVNQESKEEVKMEWMVSEIDKPESSLPEGEQPGLSVGDPHPGKHLNTRAPLPPAHPPSSSSESEAETAGRVEVKRDHMEVEMTNHEPNTSLPAFESEITSGSSHLSPVSLSSNTADRINSSDSASSSDETESDVPTPKLEPKPELRWPDLDLSSVPHVKRRLDIKVPSPTPPDSPCDGTAGHKMKQEWDRTDMEISRREPQTKWPDTDLSAVSPGPIPAESSSSSSESEDERRYSAPKPEREVGGIEREAVPHPKETLVEVSLTPKRALNITLENSMFITEGQGETAELHFKSQSSKVETESKQTESGLSSVLHIKRRLDIKAASPLQSSSSSEDEDETKWPNLDFSTIPVLKRRLDIKAPSPPPGDSFSFSSKEEGADHIIKQGERDAGDLTSEQKDSYLNVGGINVSLAQPKAPLVEVSLTPKRALNITLQNSTDITDETKDRTTADFSPDQIVTPELESRWAGMTLGVSRLRKHTGIASPKDASPKVPSAPLPESSSSSSESEDERQDRGVQHTNTGTEYNFPRTEVKKDPGDVLAALGVPRLKRRMDIKPSEKPPPAPHSQRPQVYSSSSESEDEMGKGQRETPKLYPKKAIKVDFNLSGSSNEGQGETAELHFKRQSSKMEKESKQTEASLSSVLQIKRRLDIKAASPLQSEYSSSSEGEDETSSQKKRYDGDRLDLGSEGPKPETKWPNLDFSAIPVLKRRLDIKAPSPGDSFKRRLDIKAASPLQSESSSSSEGEDEMSSQKKRHDGDRFDLGSEGPKPETKWPNLDFSAIPVLKRRLDIKAPSPGDSFSFSSKEEGADHTIKQGERDAGNFTSKQKDSYLNVGGINVSLAQSKAPLVEVSLTPKRALNITLQNSADITDEAEDRITADIRPDQIVTPELESRWAGMTLGVSRLRKHSGIASPKDASPKVPSAPLPESSSSSSESEDEHQDRGVQHTNTGTVKKDPGDVLAALGVPHLKRRMDIKSPEKPPPPPPSPRSRVSSSSSESEDGTGKGQRETPELYPKKAIKVHFVQSWSNNVGQGETAELHFSQSSKMEKETKSDLSSVLYIKRRLDLKAASPLQSESSSSSQGEDETSSQKKKHDRLDLGSKGPKPEKTWPLVDLDRIPSLKRSLDIKAPSHPPGDSSSFSSKEQSVDYAIIQGEREAGNLASTEKVQPQQEAPPAVPGRRPPLTSSSSSDSEDDKKQEREKEEITQQNQYSSFGLMSASRRPRGVLDNTSSSTDVIDGSSWSVDRREKKGLSALKAMSSERGNWDTPHEEVESGSSQQNDRFLSYHGHPTLYKYQATRDIKPLFSSTSTDGTRAAGMPHGISQFSSQTVVDTQSPPPVPGSPPPEEDGVAVPMWRSPRISEKQDLTYMGSMSSTSRKSGVEKSPSFIGLGVATPHHITQGYRSITSATQLVRTDQHESTVTNTTSKTSTLHFDHSNSITDV